VAGSRSSKACGEATRIVILTVSEQERDLLDAVAAGASATSPRRPRATSSGPPCSGPRPASRSSAPTSPCWSSASSGGWRRQATGTSPLTDREREVLSLVARGYPYKEVGAQLHIAAKTVENHVRNILDKLHLERRQELVRYALEHGIE
jgi:DNA-binding NarL/FixJ family response regulator